jgi:hypothetical protein
VLQRAKMRATVRASLRKRLAMFPLPPPPRSAASETNGVWERLGDACGRLRPSRLRTSSDEIFSLGKTQDERQALLHLALGP